MLVNTIMWGDTWPNNPAWGGMKHDPRIGAVRAKMDAIVFLRKDMATGHTLRMGRIIRG